jgi:serine/threonine-protein kinase
VPPDRTPSKPPSRASWELLFDELVGLDVAQRARRLDELRAVDGELAAKLERLLAADDGTTDFLQGSAPLHLREEGGAEAADLEPQLAVGTVIGSWRLGSLLGRGGMGEVYRAERSDPSLSQKAALKVIKRGMDSQAIVRRFLRERQILAAIEHPNLARLLDGGTGPDGRLFFAMEFVDGEPITDYCEHFALDLAGRLRLIQAVCLAVDSAHRRLVVHRDLKPANILVTADGTVKLLDFGIAKLLTAEEDDGEGGLTRVGARVLTPAYAAPEQILGEPVSTATDIYALGVLLFELITGQLPHRRDSLDVVSFAEAVGRETIERPSVTLERQGGDRKLARRVAGDLDLIVLTALHRDPARRYPSAQALADEIGRYLSGRPIHARPDALAYRVRKFVGRYRLPVAAVAVGLLALLAGTGLSLWQGYEARAAAVRAAAEARRAAAEARRAEQVKSFLISIFKQSDPESGDGTHLTARELLVRGANQLESGLAGEPQVQADLFAAVSQIEDNLSLNDLALAHAKRALALRVATLPPSDGRIGLAQSVLGQALQAAGKEAEAQKSYAEAIHLLVPAFGDDSVEVATARRGLAVSLSMARDAGKSVLLLQESLAVFTRTFGESSEETGTTLHDLGFALESSQRYAEAEVAYRRSVGVFEHRFGKGSYAVANVQSDLAGLLDRVGRGAEGKPLMESAIATERAVLGPHALRLADTTFSYALLLLSQGDYDGGDRQLEETMAIAGPAHFLYSHSLRTLGEVATRRGRYKEAIDFLTRAIDSYVRTLGEDNHQRWRARADLGWALYKAGQIGRGVEELAAAAAAIERQTGPESYDLLRPLEYLGEAQLADQPDQAVVTLRRVRALNQKLEHGAIKRDVIRLDVLLARALLDAPAPAVAAGSVGGGGEARRLLDESLALFPALKPADEELRGEALLASGRLALAEGDRPRARRELTAAQSLLTAAKDAAPADVARAGRLLAAAGAAGTSS